MTITGTNTSQGVRSDGVTSNYDSEASPERRLADLVEPEITAERWTSFVPISFELFADWSGAQAELSKMFQDAKAVEDATQFLSGSGTAEPLGSGGQLDSCRGRDGQHRARRQRLLLGQERAAAKSVRGRSGSWPARSSTARRGSSLRQRGRCAARPGRPVDGRGPAGVGVVDDGLDGHQRRQDRDPGRLPGRVCHRSALGCPVEVVSHWPNVDGFPTGQRGLLAWAGPDRASSSRTPCGTS